MLWTIEYRQTKRNAFCSVCGTGIPKNTDKVLIFTSMKGHMENVHICENCYPKLIKAHDTGKTIDVRCNEEV